MYIYIVISSFVIINCELDSLIIYIKTTTTGML